MGKNLDKFKEKVSGVPDALGKYVDKKEKAKPSGNYNKKRLNPNNRETMGDYSTEGEEGHGEDITGQDDDYNDYNDDYKDEFDVGIQPAQKPESFHHFILENQYKDLERSIRGLKDVWDKDSQTWKTKKKDIHCFTDEEAEDILRTAQSHLATDIKLGRIRTESFGDYMDTVYKVLEFIFESIAEYRYGRYNSFDKKTGKLLKVNFDKQYNMKLQNHKIFLELFTRIQANYSRAIGGAENIATHGSVKGQESLQSTERDRTGGYREGYS